uniref:Alpha-ketoglutarate-dependent dioxygenase AlkB-like domain-containing protein n=2 Tax=Panagrolaimus sp. JU765 TaxID=591449 RepID=A0AC34RPG9_9BILA
MRAVADLVKNPLVCIHNLEKWPKTLLQNLTSNCTVKEDFITIQEEESLLKEIEPHMKRLRYEKSHWDDVCEVMRAVADLVKNPLVCIHNLEKWPKTLLQNLTSNCTVKEDFITIQEEESLLKEIEPHMKRLRYEKSHWDDAIYLYREREQRRWNKENELILKRIMDISFPPDAAHLGYIHILDLHKDGCIKPHIDSIRYCGDVISGVSLMSDSVMRLRHKDEKDVLIADLFLKRRSLYKLTGIGRYEFTHEILGENDSNFEGEHVNRDRRISVICRDMPIKSGQEKLEMKPLMEIE